VQRLKKHTISFKHALDGVIYTISTQPNFTVHLFIAFLAVLLALIFGFSSYEWLILIFTIALVVIAEMVNTAIESVVDLVSQSYHLEAKKAKDVAAGMVLLTAFFAIIIGLHLYLPHLFSLIS